MGNHDYAVTTGYVADFTRHAADAIIWTRSRISEENLEYLKGLRPSAKWEIDGAKMSLFHASPRDPLMEYIFPGIPNSRARELIREGGESIVLLGHTHMPMIYSFEGQILANPGSVGQPRDNDSRASFGVLEISGSQFSFNIIRVKYAVEAVAGKILQAGLPPFLAERLYDGM